MAKNTAQEIAALLPPYRSVQQELRQLFADEGLLTLCSRCPDSCCRRYPFAFVMETADWALYAAAGIPLELSTDKPCCYLAHDGCTLPSDLRPWLCVGHLCEEWKRQMRGEAWDQLVHLLQRLDTIYLQIDALAHRRLVTGRGGQKPT